MKKALLAFAKALAVLAILAAYFFALTNIITDRCSAQLETVDIRWLGDRWGID